MWAMSGVYNRVKNAELVSEQNAGRISVSETNTYGKIAGKCILASFLTCSLHQL
jgi:hypothetical protein